MMSATAILRNVRPPLLPDNSHCCARLHLACMYLVCSASSGSFECWSDLLDACRVLACGVHACRTSDWRHQRAGSHGGQDAILALNNLSLAGLEANSNCAAKRQIGKFLLPTSTNTWLQVSQTLLSNPGAAVHVDWHMHTAQPAGPRCSVVSLCGSPQ
jgi:hypothetical protein